MLTADANLELTPAYPGALPVSACQYLSATMETAPYRGDHHCGRMIACYVAGIPWPDIIRIDRTQMGMISDRQAI